MVCFLLSQTSIDDVVFNSSLGDTGLGCGSLCLSFSGSLLGGLLLLNSKLLVHVGHHAGIDGRDGSAVRLTGGHLGNDGVELSGIDQGRHVDVLVLSTGGLVAALEESTLGRKALLTFGPALPLGILLLLGGLLGGVEGGDGGTGGTGGGTSGLLHLPPIDLTEGHLALFESDVVGHLIPQVGLLAALLPHEAAGHGSDGLALGVGDASAGADAFKDLPSDLVLGGIAVGSSVVALARGDETTEGHVAGMVENAVASAQKDVS